MCRMKVVSTLALAPAYPVGGFSSLSRREHFALGLRARGFFF